VRTETRLPGSAGEHRLQERDGTRRRAEAFYREQVLAALGDGVWFCQKRAPSRSPAGPQVPGGEWPGTNRDGG